jgi:plastocyanin
MHAFGVTNAAWIVTAATSKVPFYVVGALLACCAVGLAAVGISHPDFPGSNRGGRAVMLGVGTLVVATMATAVLTSSTETTAEQGPATAPAPAGAPVQIAADPSGQLAFQQKQVAAGAGRVTIRFDNRSPVPHNVTIAQGSRVVGATRTIAQASATLTTSLTPGSYVFYCSVDAHRQAGMHGTLTVR